MLVTDVSRKHWKTAASVMHPCLFGLVFSYFLAGKIKMEILLLQTASPAVLDVVLIAILKSFFAVRFISTVNPICRKKNGGGKFRKGPT